MHQTLYLSSPRRYVTLLILLLLSSKGNGQSFYAETVPIDIPPGAPIESRTYKLNVGNCDTTQIYTCPPTHDTDKLNEKFYTDIAIDRYQNIWYITGFGSLYKRQLNDTTTSKYIGDFDSHAEGFTCLVTDSAGILYAATTTANSGVLYKCEFTDAFPNFTQLGNFPIGMTPSGDMFFYEHRLFMVCYKANPDDLYLVEITLPDPSQSCYYMDLKNTSITPTPYGFGAFSVTTGQASKAYMIFTDKWTDSSSLAEIDIPNRVLSNVICSYPFIIGGAATFYNLSADHTTCPPLAIDDVETVPMYCKILNPSQNILRMRTNIPSSQVSSLYLYDLSGKVIKSFSTNDLPNNLDIANIPMGLYILQLTATNGKKWNEKVVKAE
jgi:hypothetical protein